MLAGPPGEHDLLLVSPIILYDHPEIAEQSEGALYDSTEIDEILTLRVMTMTDEEKAQARATDPLAAQIIDRCDAMSPEAMLQPARRAARPARRPRRPGSFPRYPKASTGGIRGRQRCTPDIDAVLVNGVRVACGSRVRLRPPAAPTRRTCSSPARSRG